jgi:hypothetical protein
MKRNERRGARRALKVKQTNTQAVPRKAVTKMLNSKNPGVMKN